MLTATTLSTAKQTHCALRIIIKQRALLRDPPHMGHPDQRHVYVLDKLLLL